MYAWIENIALVEPQLVFEWIKKWNTTNYNMVLSIKEHGLELTENISLGSLLWILCFRFYSLFITVSTQLHTNLQD